MKIRTIARLVLLLALMPLLALAQRKPAVNQAGPWRLVGVKAVGSERFPEADIVATTGLKVGSEVFPGELKTAADKLVALGVFQEVSYKYGPAGTGITAEFKVGDAPELLATSFDNFVWFSDDELTKAIRAQVPLFRGEVPPDGDMLGQVTDVLQGLLTERQIAGHVRFQLEEGHLGAKIQGGVFTVAGVPIKIAEVSFPGASPEQVQFLQEPSRSIRELPFQRSTLISFAKFTLRPQFLQRGYLKVEFGEPRTTLAGNDPAAPVVAVAIPVIPGTQYRLGAVRWTGNRAFQSLDLQKLLKMKVGLPVDAVQLERDLEAVHAVYLTRGYLREHTQEIPTWDESIQMVSYELQVNEGDQYKFGSVEITGLDDRLQGRLRSEWSMREDDPFDPGYVKKFLHSARTMLPPGAVTHIGQEINDQTRTVDVSIHFDFQKPLTVEKP